jgi:formate dehydrogenase iron-sulfur subunit
MSKGILYDATLCVNCKQCEAGCAKQNDLPYDDKVAAEPIQSEHKYTVVLNNKEKYMRRLCQHCEEPACASACPVGALHKTAAGPVVYDVYKCIGCRYCMTACAFQVPKYEWGSLNPKVRKCIMCPERVAAGKDTACAEACPTGATKFGEREDLVREAQDRVRNNPDKYVPYIYGLNEVGGSSVLMISSVEFSQFGLPMGLPTDPLPKRTLNVLEKIPDFVPLWGLVLGGVYWVSHRREEVAAAEGHEDRGGKK